MYCAWSFMHRKWSLEAWRARKSRRTRRCSTPPWPPSSPRPPLWGLEGQGGGWRQEGGEVGEEGGEKQAGRRQELLLRLVTLTPCSSLASAGSFVITFLLHHVRNNISTNDVPYFVPSQTCRFWLFPGGMGGKGRRAILMNWKTFETLMMFTLDVFNTNLPRWNYLKYAHASWSLCLLKVFESYICRQPIFLKWHNAIWKGFYIKENVISTKPIILPLIV